MRFHRKHKYAPVRFEFEVSEDGGTIFFFTSNGIFTLTADEVPPPGHWVLHMCTKKGCRHYAFVGHSHVGESGG